MAFSFFIFLTNYFKIRSLAFSWGSLTQLDCLTSPGLPSAGLIRTHQHAWFFSDGLWGLNPGPVFELTNSLPTRPSIIFWEKKMMYSPLWMNMYILYTYTIYVCIYFSHIYEHIYQYTIHVYQYTNIDISIPYITYRYNICMYMYTS